MRSGQAWALSLCVRRIKARLQLEGRWYRPSTLENARRILGLEDRSKRQRLSLVQPLILITFSRSLSLSITAICRENPAVSCRAQLSFLETLRLCPISKQCQELQAREAPARRCQPDLRSSRVPISDLAQPLLQPRLGALNTQAQPSQSARASATQRRALALGSRCRQLPAIECVRARRQI